MLLFIFYTLREVSTKLLFVFEEVGLFVRGRERGGERERERERSVVLSCVFFAEFLGSG